MLTARKSCFLLQLSSVPFLRARPVLLYVTAANRRLSDVYWLAGSGPAAVAPMEDV